MAYEVELRKVPATPILVVRRRARKDELSRVVPDGCGTVWNFIRENGITPRGRNVAIYRHTETSALDVEIGVEVGPNAIGGGEVIVSATPAGMAATVAHIGPYSLLSKANEAIKAWCDANQRQTVGPSWEVYGHWTDDVAKLRTDVFYLLKSGP
jgi:effector-binding domain-containing protein